MVLVLDEAQHVARIEHRCSMCGRLIHPGETYCRQRNIGDDGPYVWKGCAHCAAAVHILALWEYADDQGIGPDSFTDYEPASVAEARIVVGFRRKWQRPDGSLMPVPEPSAEGERSE